jgi:hypothetical protein
MKVNRSERRLWPNTCPFIVFLTFTDSFHNLQGRFSMLSAMAGRVAAEGLAHVPLRHKRNTKRRTLQCRLTAVTMDARVFGRSNSASAIAVLTIALCLGGCADDSGTIFSRPFNAFGNNLNYTYSSLDEAKQDRPLTANNLVDANGGCPRYVAPAPQTPAPGTPSADGAAPPDQGSPLGAGIGLGMSECEVVSRLGQPTAVNIDRNPNGLRSVALTFKGGPRPGLYRFADGRLSEMDRVELPPMQQPQKKQTAKKKPGANTAAPQKTGDKS